MDGTTASSRVDRNRERELVDRSRSDAAAFGELYDVYLPRIYGFAYRRLQDRPVAEDVTATTFQRALEALRQREFRHDAFGGWLYRVAASAVVDRVRDDHRIVSLAMTDGPVGDAFAASLDSDELRRAMTRLSGQHREVLTLRFFDDLDADEASAVLGCSRATFVVRLHRAITALRDVVKQEMINVA